MSSVVFFFFNDTATTEIYTLSLHDALPISDFRVQFVEREEAPVAQLGQHEPLDNQNRDLDLSFVAWLAHPRRQHHEADRKSTRLNSSHGYISYAVSCLKKKTNATRQ